MPKIIITEIDQTTPGVNAESFEVVYIPGCVDVSQSSLFNKDGEYVGIKENVPTLFTNVADFEALCGTEGLTFTEDVDYRSLISETSTGFAADSVPFDSIMFRKGDIDPAYIMAKELLTAGLNVLFERVNPDIILGEADITKLVSGGATTGEWTNNYDEYIVEDMEEVNLISDSTPPVVGLFDGTLFEVIESQDTQPVTGKTYYSQDIDDKGTLLNTYTSITFTEEKPFSATETYYNTGRQFYTVDDEGSVTKTWVAYNGYTVENLKLAPLEEVPNNWATTYWKDYVEIVMKDMYVPPVNSGTLDQPQKSAPPVGFITAKEAKLRVNKKGVDIVQLYNALEGVFDSGDTNGLADKGNFSIKYLTSGGYPVYEYNSNTLVSKMIALAENRGDCVAIIDHTDNLYREENVALAGSLYKAVENDATFNTGGEYATMFTPWATYNRTTTDYSVNDEGTKEALTSEPYRMPASFAYLTSLADSIKTNASWLAVAGAARGGVANLASGGMTTEIPNGAADKMQPRQGISINAITNIKPYGFTIWGNRTLKRNAVNLTATSFLNIRNLVSDVKKTCYRAARALTFEQNTEVLWVNFKSKIAPTLDRMTSGYGISGYKIVRDLENEKAQEKATICAKVILYPVYAVEDFYITIVLKDDEINVESAE